MTTKANCKHCGRPITLIDGRWRDMGFYGALEHVSGICKALPNEPIVNHEPREEENTGAKCSYCHRAITHDGKQWVALDGVLPQYCYADMSGGSRLHTP